MMHRNPDWDTIINGMGDVGLVRYEPAVLRPCLTITVLSKSNCQRSTHSISKWIFTLRDSLPEHTEIYHFYECPHLTKHSTLCIIPYYTSMACISQKSLWQCYCVCRRDQELEDLVAEREHLLCKEDELQENQKMVDQFREKYHK